MENTTPGDRIREVRKRGGLSQQALADRSGLSVATIRKLEQGVNQVPRGATLLKLAMAMGVTVTDLITIPDAPVSAPASAQRWEPLRLALEGRHLDEPDEVPDTDGLARSFRDALPLHLDSQFWALGAVLPVLLRDADALVAGSVNGTRVRALRLRSQIRQITGSLMLHNWQFATAERAFALAMDDAPDALTAASVTDERCWGLIRQGRLADTADAALELAEQNQPRLMVASRDELAAYGRLMIRASMAAVRDGRPDDAAEMIRRATMAAAGCGGDFVLPYSPWHVFGPVTVSVFAAELAMIREQPEKVLSIGRRLSGARPAMPLRRTAPSFRLDLASAHAMLRHDEKAVKILRQLRDDRPLWFPRQRYAADILALIIRRRRTLTDEIKALADAANLPL